jgi:hypothetical protein
MSQAAQDIEKARRLYVAAMGTPKEPEMRRRFELVIDATRKRS